MHIHLCWSYVWYKYEYAAAITTFVRFFPRIKARYDYGFLIFILTFCLVSVSGYREDEILKVAYRRALTILIGTFIAILICILICPVWAGDDLHSLVSNNIEQLANFFQGMFPLTLISFSSGPKMPRKTVTVNIP